MFDDPERFDITRTPNDHMAFGFGSHFCLGNRLARMELSVMFDRLLDRLPDLALADDGRPAQAGGQLRLRLRDHAGGVHADGPGRERRR